MAEVLKRFGRYYLLDMIAQGGMAEIYRGRPATADGGGRLLVIKRIQAGFGGNTEFQKMFESEIKVTMGFNHPNIVQLYDFGEEQKQPYIAMELVDGKNVRQFLNRFKDMKQSFPVEAAAYIMEQAAAGLFYAHTYKDKISGESLGIVHRDISPQNILVSYEGVVKVIDFGIAKAKTNSEATRAGVIKGKPSYLAPEQITGEILDGRTDQFALGAVFWELLVGKKLFQGDNDLAVLKQIESCTTIVKPPSTLNPQVPKELDKIIMKMLSKQPSQRFANCEEVSKVLRKFLILSAPDFSGSDLSHFSKELFKAEIVEDRKRIQVLNERVEQMIAKGAELEEIEEKTKTKQQQQAAQKKKSKKGDTETFVGGRSKTIEYVVEPEKLDIPLHVERPARGAPSTPAARTSTTPAATAQSQFTVQTRVPTQGSGLRQSPTRYGGYNAPEEAPEGTSPWLKVVAVLAAVLGFSYYGPQFGYEIPYISSLIAPQPPEVVADQPTTPTVERSPASQPEQVPVPVRKAKLKVGVNPDGADVKVTVNGTVLAAGVRTIDVPVETPIELLVEKPDFLPFRSEFKIDERSLNKNDYLKDVWLTIAKNKEWNVAPIVGDQVGYLSVFSTPSAEVTIYVNNRLIGKRSSPFQRLKIPAGKVQLHLYSGTTDVESQAEFLLEKNQLKSLTNFPFKPRKRGIAGGSQ